MPWIDPRRCEVREQGVRTWLYHPMCSFFVRLESIEKTNKFGSRWKTKFFWPFDVGPSSVDRYILVKTHVLQSTNRTPLHMSWDSVLIILLNYHSNFSVVSFFIHFHLCIVLVFGTRGCSIIGGFISSFPVKDSARKQRQTQGYHHLHCEVSFMSQHLDSYELT